MKSRSAKSKGRRLQKLVADAILKCFPRLTKNDVRPVMMSGSGMDIQLSEAARKQFPYAIECKNQEAIAIWAALRQAADHAASDSQLIPLVVFARNNTQPYVALPFSDFMSLVATLRECSLYIPRKESEHVCGLQGYDPTVDPPCPGCK